MLGWLFSNKLTASDASPYSSFGWSVASSGSRILIGAAQGAGAAYMFEKQGGSWTETQKITPSDAAPNDVFGVSLAMWAERAVIGSILDDDNGPQSGSAYVFELEGGSWIEKAKLLPDDGSGGDRFGESVATSVERVVVGKQLNPPGAVYLFESNGNGWAQTDKLLSDDCCGSFGENVAIYENHVLAGQPLDSPVGGNSGSVVAFILDCSVTSYCSPAAPNTVSATGAKFTVVGIPSTQLNELEFQVIDLPSNLPGIFFYGPFQAQLPFGNGFVCVGGSVNRVLPALISDPMGTVRLDVDLTQPPFGSGAGAVLPGSTWNFQYWYRDPTGFPTTFNLSDAVQITFAP